MRTTQIFAAIVALSAGEQELLHKVGFPAPRFEELSACGEEYVNKQAFNPSYLWHLTQGFKPGSCVDAGYDTFLKNMSVIEKPLPGKKINRTVSVYTRNVTFMDAFECIGRECTAELGGIVDSDYRKDAAHCIAPAFEPCAEKAWACLGDETCRAAVECMPKVAKECGEVVWRAVTDKEEREKIECIEKCGSDRWCVLTKCGKNALECFLGIDKLCHQALTCLPTKTLSCSKPAFGCLFSRDGLCRQNLACIAEGVNACGDSAVNLLTDKAVPALMTCAGSKCPRVSTGPWRPNKPTAVLEAEASTEGGLSNYVEQLACMNLHCGLKAAALLFDKDVDTLATCMAPPMHSCGQDLWDCLGDEECRNVVECWGNGTLAEVSDVWTMATNKDERQFLTTMVDCGERCLNITGVVQKGLCISKCGLKSAKCLEDATCRHTLENFPEMAARCGAQSVKSKKFQAAGKCMGAIADSCGRAGIELVRDPKIAEVLVCNQRCTHEPKHWPSENLVV